MASSVSFAPAPASVLAKHGDARTFAFARLHGTICLVQLAGQSTLDPSGTPLLDILVFRHEFVSIFRYSHSARVHPLELKVLEPLDDYAVRYEPDNGSVFLAKDLMAHLKRILDATAMYDRAGGRSGLRRQRARETLAVTLSTHSHGQLRAILMSVLPKHVSGFTPIPVAYARSTHILYARAHISKPRDAHAYPDGRTLFLVNVPVDATDREIALFLKPCGPVERVTYLSDAARTDAQPEGDEDASDMGEASTSQAASDKELQPQPIRKKRRKATATATPPSVVPLPPLSTRPLRKTGAIAHVVFLDAASLEKALAPPGKPRPWPSSEEPRGLAHYAALYDASRPPLDLVKAHADSWMERFEFDLAKTRQKAAYRKGEQIVDEDGFILVTRGGAYGQTLGGGVGVASKTFEETGRTQSRKKKEPKEKGSFYAFQKVEKQRKALLDLRKNFEADKARVEKLKESRRFRPY